MATILNWYFPGAFELPQSGSNIPNKTTVVASNFTQEVLQLDPSTDNEFTWVPDFSQYVSGNITFYPLGWANATTGNMRFGIQFMSHAVNHGASYLTRTFATATLANVAALANANDLIMGTIVCSSNLDSITSAKSTRIKGYRDADDGTNDTLTVLFNLMAVGVAYDI